MNGTLYRLETTRLLRTHTLLLLVLVVALNRSAAREI